MATEVTSGTIPLFYKDIYDSLTADGAHAIEKELLLKLLTKSGLQPGQINEIIYVSCKSNRSVNRNNVYKSLAMTALCQKGRNVDEKLYESFVGELPQPNFGNVGIDNLRVEINTWRRDVNPSIFGYNYEQLTLFDTIQVEAVSEKKGYIVKHIEYDVTSAKFKSKVTRRYSDFVTFRDLLVTKYPYRMVPKLPPKKFLDTTPYLIGTRQKWLRRFINILSRHPSFHDDALLKFFLTHSGHELQDKIKMSFKNAPDEFLTNPSYKDAKDYVSSDVQQQITMSKQQVSVLSNTVDQILTLVEHMITRSRGDAADLLKTSQTLGLMANDSTSVSSWGCPERWSELRAGLVPVTIELTHVADRSDRLSREQSDKVIEHLSLLQDVINAYKELCERHEKGMVKEHSNALHRMGITKQKKMTATVRGNSADGEHFDSRIHQQEGELVTMEQRNFFSLHCLHLETQLVFVYLELLPVALDALTKSFSNQGRAVVDAWVELIPKVECLVAGFLLSPDSSSASSPARPGSPFS